jgi:hypothetical protein
MRKHLPGYGEGAVALVAKANDEGRPCIAAIGEAPADRMEAVVDCVGDSLSIAMLIGLAIDHVSNKLDTLNREAFLADIEEYCRRRRLRS